MRCPATAFTQYVAMGDHRSYSRLSRQIGISKRSIVVRAVREGWQERLRAIEMGAQATAVARVQDDIAAIHERHLKAARVVQAKALETLRAKAFDSAKDAAIALAAAQREERRIVAGPAAAYPRFEVSVERGVREHYERRTVAVEAPLAAAPPAEG